MHYIPDVIFIYTLCFTFSHFILLLCWVWYQLSWESWQIYDISSIFTQQTSLTRNKEVYHSIISGNGEKWLIPNQPATNTFHSHRLDKSGLLLLAFIVLLFSIVVSNISCLIIFVLYFLNKQLHLFLYSIYKTKKK